MQKITLYLLVVFTQIAFGQTEISETEKLVATCKIWGFLKYYHPKVANGEMNWDEQLMALLPKIDQAQHQEEVSLILENWIDELGPVKKIAPIVIPKDVAIFDKNFDLSWFDNKLFSKKLSKKLKFIEENRFQSDKEFDNSFDSFAKIKNYFDLKYSNRNSRLLMLFVYWNAIEYYFPYKYVMDQKWDLSLQQIIPAITAATNEIDFYNEMQKLTTKLNDSHVEFVRYPTLSASKAFTYFPATGKIIDEKLIVTEILGDSLAEADTIKIGDVITKINGKTIQQLISENRELICASNEAKYLDKIIAPILKSDSENVKVEFLKEGKYVTKSMIWGDRHESHRNEYKKGALKKKEKFKIL